MNASLDIIVDSNPLGRDLVCEDIDTTGPGTPDTAIQIIVSVQPLIIISLHNFKLDDRQNFS